MEVLNRKQAQNNPKDQGACSHVQTKTNYALNFLIFFLQTPNSLNILQDSHFHQIK